MKLRSITNYTTALLLLIPSITFAFSWTDLWLRRDQQATQALNNGDPNHAAHLFTRPDWRGTAYYRGGNYDQALKEFSEDKDADALYNSGNALAHMGRYEEAIAKYNAALKQRPHHLDAQHNKALLERLLKQNNQASTGQQPQNQPESSDNDKEQRPDNKSQQSNASDQNNSQQNAQQQNMAPETQQQSQNEERQQPQQTDEQADQSDSASNTMASISEEEQAAQQSLQRIPDDPGGLLKRRFLRDHKRRLLQTPGDRQS